jgi:hypothetical protein
MYLHRCPKPNVSKTEISGPRWRSELPLYGGTEFAHTALTAAKQRSGKSSLGFGVCGNVAELARPYL